MYRQRVSGAVLVKRRHPIGKQRARSFGADSARLCEARNRGQDDEPHHHLGVAAIHRSRAKNGGVRNARERGIGNAREMRSGGGCQ
eukprot:3108105-Pleurochrysis_carterae.AAC.2